MFSVAEALDDLLDWPARLADSLALELRVQKEAVVAAAVVVVVVVVQKEGPHTYTHACALQAHTRCMCMYMHDRRVRACNSIRYARALEIFY